MMKKRILIVDDEYVYCRYISQTLTERGYDVATAASAEEALEQGRKHAPAILVVDLKLKEERDGLQLIRGLRLLNPQLRSVLMTGFVSCDITGEREELGISCLLEKPFELAEIVEAVAQAEAETE